MLALVLLVLAVTLLAYANGANDNLKGVATLLGSRTVGWRGGLAWATATTAAGSLVALLLAASLVTAFSGEGLVAPDVLGEPAFLLAVAAGAAGTVLLATVAGLPISTTHALVGALVGAGLATPGGGLEPRALGGSFVLPLAASPLLAVALAAGIHRIGRVGAGVLGLTDAECICVGEEPAAVPATGAPLAPAAGAVAAVAVEAASTPRRLAVIAGTDAACAARFHGSAAVSLPVRRSVDALHFVSAGAVGFARGVNDTPKIVALLVAARALAPGQGLVLVGAAMAVGGVLQARRVATTMSERITRMTPAQGLGANLSTAFLVLVASRLGLPVSTTHVSCGSLFGLGVSSGGGRWATMGRILSAWVFTLPVAAALAALAAAAGRWLA